MAGRRATINWAKPPEDGDAAAASADIAAFLAQRRERDWEGLLERMREALTRLCVSPFVRRDPVCQGIIGAMAQAQDMAALDAAAERLRIRVDDLVASRAASRPALAATPDPAAARAAGRRRFTV